MTAPARARARHAPVIACATCDDTCACKRHVGANVRCRQCAGTGQFITGTHNGKPTGPGGACYRCNGKGYHDKTDRTRNRNYERYGRRYA